MQEGCQTPLSQIELPLAEAGANWTLGKNAMLSYKANLILMVLF